jgi:hypothetical protein
MLLPSNLLLPPLLLLTLLWPMLLYSISAVGVAWTPTLVMGSAVSCAPPPVGLLLLTSLEFLLWLESLLLPPALLLLTSRLLQVFPSLLVP